MQELFQVLVERFFHLADGLAVRLQILRLIEGFGLVVFERLDVIDRHAQKGGVVPGLGHVEETVEVPLLIGDVATLDVQHISVVDNGCIHIFPNRVVVRADCGVLVRIYQRLERTRPAKPERRDHFFIPAGFKKRLAARLALQSIVQPLILFVEEIILGDLHGVIQKLVDGHAVGVGEVRHNVHGVETGNGFVHAVFWREVVVSDDVDVARTGKIVALGVHREMLPDVADEFVGVRLFGHHCFGGLGNLGRVARLDRVLISVNGIGQFG